MNSNSRSSHRGMGSIVYPDGCAFRVWAPHADHVYVTGTFNHWSKTAHALAREGNGYWSVDVPGAKPGDEYKYLIVAGSNEFYRLDPYARHVACSTCNSIIHDPAFDWGAAFSPPPLNELMIYELHIGTFNDEPGGRPGNLRAAMEKLSYLKDLGVNAIEVMPAMEFAGAFSWGYNPSNVFALESDYGRPNDLKEFVKAAHAHGLGVIFDVVYNHFGPTDLDLWQFDGWNENGKGGVYFYNDGRSKTPWGDTRPDYGREPVRQYLRDNALMWIEEYQADGLRWDATAFIRNLEGNDDDPAHDIPDGWSLMQWVNGEIRARHPGAIRIAEDLRNNSFVTKDANENGAAFDAQWDAQFAHDVRDAIITGDDGARNLPAVAKAIAHRYNDDAFERVIYTESHDEVANGKARVPEQIAPGNAGTWAAKKRSTLGAALVFTSSGVPMIFQGQEFLEDDWFHERDPIDWSKKDTYKGILQLYRDLIRLRRNRDGNTRGLCGQNIRLHHVDPEGKVIAFHRFDHAGPRDSVLVVVNMKDRPCEDYVLGFPRPGLWKVRFNSDAAGYDKEFGNYTTNDTVAGPGEIDGMPCHAKVDVGPYTAIILSQDE